MGVQGLSYPICVPGLEPGAPGPPKEDRADRAVQVTGGIQEGYGGGGYGGHMNDYSAQMQHAQMQQLQ